MVPLSSLYKVTVWADKFLQKKKYSYVINHPRVVESIKYQKNHLWRAYPYQYCVQIKVVTTNAFT